MFRNRSADASHFAMIPDARIPRAKFTAEQRHLSTFDAGYLVPIYVDEVLPGDSHNLSILSLFGYFNAITLSNVII